MLECPGCTCFSLLEISRFIEPGPVQHHRNWSQQMDMKLNTMNGCTASRATEATCKSSQSNATYILTKTGIGKASGGWNVSPHQAMFLFLYSSEVCQLLHCEPRCSGYINLHFLITLYLVVQTDRPLLLAWRCPKCYRSHTCKIDNNLCSTNHPKPF